MDEWARKNRSTMKKGLILGRFQPFHFGHLELLPGGNAQLFEAPNSSN